MQNLSPIGWALRPLKNYAKFSGRASRAEFWWFFLFLFVIWMAVYFLMIGTLMGAANGQNPPSAGLMGMFGGFGIVLLLFWLAMLLPTLAVQTRRLHDTNRSGWWLGGFYLLYVVYFVMLFGTMGSMMVGGAAQDPSKISGGMFGATMILGLIMFIYMIALIVFYCLPGTKGPNNYGDDPYGPDVERVFA